MAFQTFTCVVCGKTGLTKRNSYRYASGRACRAHQEVADEAKRRLHPEEFDPCAKAKHYVERFIKTVHIRPPVSCSSFDTEAIQWIVQMMTAALEVPDINTPDFIREMISQLKETVPYQEATHWYLDAYVELLEAWNPDNKIITFADMIGRGRDQWYRVRYDMKNINSYRKESGKIWANINYLVKLYNTDREKYNQCCGTIIDTLKRMISLIQCIDETPIAQLNQNDFGKEMEHLTFIVKVRTLINKKESGLKENVFVDMLECIIKNYKGYLFK